MKPLSILITGATGGIGAALALRYAGSGVHLALTGRNSERLSLLATECRRKGATVNTKPFDVRNKQDAADWIHAADQECPIQIGIANAGVTSGSGLDRPRESHAAAERVIATNILGTLNTIEPLVECMLPRASGQLAIVGSLAGYRGFPFSPAYSASKAALRTYAEALRAHLRPRGIHVALIAPGFVATNMLTDTRYPKPFLIEPNRAAKIIQTGLQRRRSLIAFPWPLYIGMRLLRVLPARAVDHYLNLIPVDIPEWTQ